MKHVIVIDSRNSARPFIEAQGLKHPQALENHRMDSELLFTRPELMQSTDGIQFYLFTQKFPATNAGHFTGFEHLERHVEIMAEQLRRRNKTRRPDDQETLDAIVITEGAVEKSSTLRWLGRMREQWPQLKVMVTNPKVHAVTDPLRDDVFVQALHDDVPPQYTDPKYHPTNRNPYVPVQQNATNFRLAPQVDMATPNLRDLGDNALLLRHLIGQITIASGKDAAAGVPKGGKGRG